MKLKITFKIELEYTEHGVNVEVSPYYSKEFLEDYNHMSPEAISHHFYTTYIKYHSPGARRTYRNSYCYIPENDNFNINVEDIVESYIMRLQESIFAILNYLLKH